MKLSDFDFVLPEELIATRPARPRTSARLLVANGDEFNDLHVRDIVDQLAPGDRLILNDTKVIPARLTGHRTRESAESHTTARIEVTLLEPQTNGNWSALIKPLKKVKDGETIVFSDDLSAVVASRSDGQAILAFNLAGDDFDTALADVGAMPLPPYIAAKRPADEADKIDYQTAWAKHAGAVAAPTASLHFDADLLAALKQKGVTFSHVTLHVGAGTFLPVKVDDITQHKMHAEWGHVSQSAAAEINATKAAGGRIIPVGTTALRLIESAAKKGQVGPWKGPTDIFITPGYQFQITDGLMTNFHLPKSTLMMLVSALMGTDRIKAIYKHAISHRYRFFSYGDSSLLLPP
ncbi:S-adenosylmethionine:tRNA ribosyltransferase-isomerase [Cognatiyoonia koreensis]|uniref:S-adenosylmethionine:tRNA ribosyltransferase-isomerase n=1 Tax=Cognatiyoonia koreensis TaxID=364200 RepID=A0A1I0PN59_9RHOB|nr:tRNA preQ1(34) S-adenosylmethionine ribosyltransferase-isomerase QueA [Cognatiyoonia koreensis]SEW15867.1 S-adenosylmethionine:tRNA ribosyltransferase-isomerase [Cognatiyoonia koreensis]